MRIRVQTRILSVMCMCSIIDFPRMMDLVGPCLLQYAFSIAVCMVSCGNEVVAFVGIYERKCIA